jgi:hypothetical protein
MYLDWLLGHFQEYNLKWSIYKRKLLFIYIFITFAFNFIDIYLVIIQNSSSYCNLLLWYLFSNTQFI